MSRIVWKDKYEEERKKLKEANEVILRIRNIVGQYVKDKLEYDEAINMIADECGYDSAEGEGE